MSQPSDYERNCRFANNLVATATANLERAVAFGLHAAADCPDHELSSEQVKLAGELRKTHRRLAHIHFSPPDGAPVSTIAAAEPREEASCSS